MSLFDKIRGLFQQKDVPEEAKKLFAGTRTPEDVLRGLDQLLTRNEVQARQTESELVRLERAHDEEAARVKSGTLSERTKRAALLNIQRLREQLKGCEERLQIYHRNIRLHQALMAKIQHIQAMELAGVHEQQVDEVSIRYEESLEKHTESLHAASVLADRSLDPMSSQEERELRDLEAELLGKPVVEPKERSTPVVEAPARAKEVVPARPLPSLAREKRTGEAKSSVPSDDELDRMERELLEE